MASNGSFVKRFVLNNNSTKKVTIVIWGKLIDEFDSIIKTGNVSISFQIGYVPKISRMIIIQILKLIFHDFKILRLIFIYLDH